ESAHSTGPTHRLLQRARCETQIGRGKQDNRHFGKSGAAFRIKSLRNRWKNQTGDHMRTVIACISTWLGQDGAGLYVPRSYGSFFLPACKKGERYSKLVIEDQTDFKRI